MLTKAFDYNLPPELIAQDPAEPRDHSRLMVVNRRTGQIEHRHFFDIVDYLKPCDLFVWNNSKVFKARLRARINNANLKRINSNGGKGAEVFLVRPVDNLGLWQALAKPAKKLLIGETISFGENLSAKVIDKKEDGTILSQFNLPANEVRNLANKYGEVPLPPYIKNFNNQKDLTKKYQTVYAQEEGSVAAPTAGFHFTPELIERIKNKGVELAEVTLHVGLGTFLPVKSENINDHKMHSEWVEVSGETAEKINLARQKGQRVIAVGTTTVRTLEGLYKNFGEIKKFSGDLNLFITPGFKFAVVDVLITNFHLPKSTLLMLVSAFAETTGDIRDGREFMLKCYREAVEKGYRFYSFGDAMVIV